MPQLSQHGAQMVAILENARQLAVRHQQRLLAAKEIRSCAIYARTLSNPEIQEKMLVLSSLLRDKNNVELNALFDQACLDVVRLVG